MSDSRPQPRATSQAARLAKAHAAARALRRQRARERIEAWVVHPIDGRQALPDPLQHGRSRAGALLSGLRLLLAAVVLHGLMLAVLFAANALVGERVSFQPDEKVAVRIVEPEPEAEAEAEAEREREREPVAEAEPVAETDPEPAAEAAPPPADTPEPPRPRPRSVSPRADPIDPPAAGEPPPAVPRRRIVGLSMESTVVGGGGPGFAVGTTRMGKTEQRAIAAREASQARGLPEVEKAPPPAPAAAPTGGNRVATRLPTAAAPIVKPRRLAAVKPTYPPMLKEQGIEGDVVLMVTIDEQGRVTRVLVVRKSPQAAFNEAAVAAAKQERYAPATRGGTPMVFTQRYTVRFRLND